MSSEKPKDVGRGRYLVGRPHALWKDPHTPDSEEGEGIFRQHAQRGHGPRRDHLILLPVLRNPAQCFGPRIQDSDIREPKIPDGELKEGCFPPRGLRQNNPRLRPHHGNRNTWDSGAAAEIEDGARVGEEWKDVHGTEDEDASHLRGGMHPREAKPLIPLDDQRYVTFEKSLLGGGKRDADLCRPGLQDPAEGLPGRHVVL